MGKVCTATDESERNEQWYAASVLKLENYCREMVNSCLCKTIGALPNYGVISEEQFSESIVPDEFVKDLMGLYTQSVIKTPKEWYELIEYIPQFVENS